MDKDDQCALWPRLVYTLTVMSVTPYQDGVDDSLADDLSSEG
jgi:hypothetical protein